METIESAPETSALEIAPDEIPATVLGAQLISLSSVEKILFRRQIVCDAIAALATLSWLLALIACDRTLTYLPWTVLLILILIGSTARLCALVQSRRSAVFGDAGLIRDFSGINECVAYTYVAVSLCFTAWLIHSGLQPVKSLSVERQVVDIELVALTDYIDNHEVLPGTKELQSLRKLTSPAQQTRQGSLSPVQSEGNFDKPEKTLQITRKDIDRKRPDNSSNKDSQPINMTVLAPLKAATAQGDQENSPMFLTGTYAPPKVAWKRDVVPVKRAAQKNSEDLLLEEVKPPELFEVTENRGESDSVNLFQAGGHSSGGMGSKTLLVDYLKYLHKRIKNAWKPPSGIPRSAEILFRIGKTGKLLSIRLVQTSGDSTSDEAAIKAIASCQPLKPLPSDYSADVLDVQYTFNYRVDELTEAPESP